MSDRMLHGVYAVWCPVTRRDVDVEPLCRGAVSEVLRTDPVPLERCDYEHLLAFALGQVVILRRKYDPGRRVPLRLYLYGELRNDVRDEIRHLYRKGALAGGRNVLYGNDPLDAGLDEAVAPFDSDAAGDGRDAFGGALSRRDREVLEEIRVMGLGPGDRVADGHHQPAVDERVAA